MLHLPGFYYVKKPKRFVILCSDKSSERNLSCFFDMRKARKMEHLQKEEPFSSDPYFSRNPQNYFYQCVGQIQGQRGSTENLCNLCNSSRVCILHLRVFFHIFMSKMNRKTNQPSPVGNRVECQMFKIMFHFRLF